MLLTVGDVGQGKVRCGAVRQKKMHESGHATVAGVEGRLKPMK